MPGTSSEVDNRIAALALAVIDLRAHFEAQLRRMARAEAAFYPFLSLFPIAVYASGPDTHPQDLP
jgi:hypothetical protein